MNKNLMKNSDFIKYFTVNIHKIILKFHVNYFLEEFQFQ